MITIHVCQCPICKNESGHPNKESHKQMNLLLSRLDEQQRRWYVAMESNRFGHGGDRLLSQITGLDEKTIRQGRQELENDLKDCPENRIRHQGGGRSKVEKKRHRSNWS